MLTFNCQWGAGSQEILTWAQVHSYRSGWWDAKSSLHGVAEGSSIPTQLLTSEKQGVEGGYQLSVGSPE